MACSSDSDTVAPSNTPRPIATNTPTATPVPPEVLDWHIQFSSDQDAELFRCRVIRDIDGITEDLIRPLNVQVTGVILSPQILNEVQRTFEQVNASIPTNVNQLLSNPELLMILLQLEFMDERDIHTPFVMYLPTNENSERPRNTLNEIRFRFGASNSRTPLMQLRIGDRVILPRTDLPDLELEVDRVYPFVFDISHLESDKVIGNNIELKANLELLVPFAIDTGFVE